MNSNGSSAVNKQVIATSCRTEERWQTPRTHDEKWIPNNSRCNHDATMSHHEHPKSFVLMRQALDIIGDVSCLSGEEEDLVPKEGWRSIQPVQQGHHVYGENEKQMVSTSSCCASPVPPDDDTSAFQLTSLAEFLPSATCYYQPHHHDRAASTDQERKRDDFIGDASVPDIVRGSNHSVPRKRRSVSSLDYECSSPLSKNSSDSLEAAEVAGGPEPFGWPFCSTRLEDLDRRCLNHDVVELHDTLGSSTSMSLERHCCVTPSLSATSLINLPQEEAHLASCYASPSRSLPNLDGGASSKRQRLSRSSQGGLSRASLNFEDLKSLLSKCA